jgi:signal transduction histidine kinase
MNPAKIYNKISDKIYGDFESVLENTPEKLLDEDYLLGYADELTEKETGFIVQLDEEEFFSSSFLNSKNLDSLLEEFSDIGALGVDSMVYGDEGYRHICRYISGKVNGKKIEIYIFTYINDIFHWLNGMVLQCIVMVIVILFITSGFLIRDIYNATIVPLNKLRAATVNIKEGNLDFELEKIGDADDVIQGLFDDFEAMRDRLKENADEKLRYDKDSKELISNISHDLRTPLTAIKGYVEGLVDGVAMTPQMKERYLKTIYNKAIDMDRLIDELTLYAKIDTNRIPYKFEKVSLTEFFDDCADSLSVELKVKNIQFGYYNTIKEDVWIVADIEQLSRIVNNIVNNSVKYMNNPEGKITLTLLDEGDFVRIELKDNGQGISKNDLPHIFERFYRSDASRNSATGGSGIGLAIVKKIVEDHGGRIWAESQEGHGTKMCFVIRKYLEDKKK